VKRAAVLRHGALEPIAGHPPDRARLTDRQRLAVVLQGVAVLGHLERAGRGLAGGWNGARITADGRLVGILAGPPDGELPQRRAEELLLALFGADRAVAGRGEARCAARRLVDRWRQGLEPVAGDRLVAQVLAAAPFLWQEPFGQARVALASQIGTDAAGLWVVGPGRFRRRLLPAAADLEGLRELLAGPEAIRFWRRPRRPGEARELARRGLWLRAVECWEDLAPSEPDARLEMARALYAVGRFASAAEALRGLKRAPARVLRLACQLRLGALAAARRGLARWSGPPPADECAVELAAVATRLFASLGDPAAATPWLERALASREPALLTRARLLAGEAAWDRGDLDGVEKQLAATLPAAEDPHLAWRRAHLAALLAMARGTGEEVVRSMTSALAHRRRVRPFEAAGLWNDLAVGRSMTGDLAGAERALRHVVRLSRDSEGDRRTTLALCNLAEIRLRRGRVRGVRRVVERSAKANWNAGNWRGWAQDRELATRYELVRGRPGAAIACVEQTRETLARHGVSWRSGQLAVLAARAHGWLGEVGAARAELEATTAEERAELEPEERAPLWALAGDLENALAENGPGPAQRLWRQLLTGERQTEFSALVALEPYRAARLVLDADLLRPGCVPVAWLRRAAVTLRDVGAGALAERFDASDHGPLRAVAGYLEAVEGTPVERLAALWRELTPEARLSWRDADSEVELVAASGGRQTLERAFHGGTLRCEASRLGLYERVALGFAARDLPAPAAGGGARSGGGRRYGLVGRSDALLAALERLSKLAARDLPILVEGETGTGKELAARAVHAASRRAGEAFLPVNCAALAESLLLSELFGHVKGAFTGADRDRAGIFEAARGGTVFLDEIGDLPLQAQGKLLRVLQEGEVRRVGESISRPVDVRIVAATHRDLKAMVDGGAFREDLYYRLGVGRVPLPPLRDRGDDLFLLCGHFLSREEPGTTVRLSEGARARLMAHDWPGNVRELRNILRVAVALAGGATIEADHLDLPTAVREPRCGYHERVEDFRRRLVADALQAEGGNRAAAARRLGLSRQALSYLVRQLDI
jgi:two-component system, NtrC family, response regulator